LSASSERRKQEEAEFHDLLRSLHEKDPKKYSYYTSNKKFYTVAGSSRAFVEDWLRANATGKRVLDFGCGSGHYAVPIAAFAGSVTGIDISPEAIKLSKEAAAAAGVSDKTDFQVMDAENLTFPPGSFDVVTVTGVLHHMDLDAALTQIHRVLVPNGKAIFLEALADNPIIHAYRMRTPHLRTPWETEHILRSGSAKAMRKYFKQVEVRYFHLAVLAAVPLRSTPLFEPVRAALDALDSVILRIPGLGRQAWMGCFILADPA